MEKFRNTYRIPSARLQSWDYRWAGAYFITICTKHRLHYFGEIKNHSMILSEIGNIVESEWLKTFALRPDMNLFMGEFIVMPNHFHAIIGIGENEYNTPSRKDAMHRVSTHNATINHPNINHVADCRDAMHCVSTHDTTTNQNRFGPQSKNVASILRGFKSSVTVSARRINPAFHWQTRFHDHIIRNEDALNTISHYIVHNPAHWYEDTFFSP